MKLFYDFLTDHPVIPADPLEVQLGVVPQRIDERYGVRVQQPVDRWFLPSHVTDDVPQRAIPRKDQLREFFSFVRLQTLKSQKPLTISRDYALFRMLYHTGLRANEALMLELRDLRFDLGTVHVRFGKGTKGSGPRERYVPLRFGGLDNILQIYLKQIRPKFLTADRCEAVFLSEWGGRMGKSTIERRLKYLVLAAQEHSIDVPLFSPHDLRRACATHLYEQFPDKVEAIRQLLGHWQLATTQKYLRPSALFIERQFAEITSERLARLRGGDPID